MSRHAVVVVAVTVLAGVAGCHRGDRADEGEGEGDAAGEGEGEGEGEGDPAGEGEGESAGEGEGEGEPAGEGEGEGEGDVDVVRVAGVSVDVAYGSDPLQRLDVYVPAGVGAVPAVVYVHGGAWMVGDKARVGDKAALINGLGMVFVSVNYRLSPDPPSDDPARVLHPAHVDDVTAAVAYVLDHAADYGIDAGRVGLMGHSAGAHLVALAGADPARARDRVRCVFANDTEALDINAAFATASPRQRALYTNAFGSDAAVYDDASPIGHVSSSTPPFLLTRRGARDREAILDGFVAALSAVDVDVNVIDAGGLSHEDVSDRVGDPDDDVLTPTVSSFFSRCLLP